MSLFNIQYNTRADNNEPHDDVGFYIKDPISFNSRLINLSDFIPHVFACQFIEINLRNRKKKPVGVIYSTNTVPRADVDVL